MMTILNLHRRFLKLCRRWRSEEEAVAAIEFSLLFPILMALLVGVFDMGYGILAAQKTIRASQVTADLIARHKSVTEAEIREAIDGGRLALVPFDTGAYGYDIISIEFDEDTRPILPPLWRRTSGNIEANDGFTNSLTGLGSAGEGLVVVRVRYEYKPLFSGYLFGSMNFNEIAFLRPRNSPTVPLAGAGQGA